MLKVLLFLVGVTVVRESNGVSLPSDSTSASYDPDDDGLGFEEYTSQRNDLESVYQQQRRPDAVYNDDFRIARKRSSPDSLTRRSSLDKNFMRFGRSGFFPSDRCCKHRDPVGVTGGGTLSRDETTGESGLSLSFGRSSRDAPVGSGRSSDNFIRFGRRDDGNNFMRFGRRHGDNFMRFGRDDKNNFMRFGRADKNFMRFGRGDKENFMRFGRGEKDNFLRFGRGDKDNFMRFGRGEKDNFMRFGRGDKENFMRFGRGDENHRYRQEKKKKNADGINPSQRSYHSEYEPKGKDGDGNFIVHVGKWNGADGSGGENGTEESRFTRITWDDEDKEDKEDRDEKGSGERRVRRTAEFMPRSVRHSRSEDPAFGADEASDRDSSEYWPPRTGGYGKESKAAAFIRFG